MCRAFIFSIFLFLSFAGLSQGSIHKEKVNGQGSLIVIDDALVGARKPSQDFVIIKSIELQHNQVTRNRIIRREILFETGDTLITSEFLELAENSRQNLLNTSLFNFVEIIVDLEEQPYAQVVVSFVERWYLWPFPILELGERNLNMWLGNPRFSSLNYGLNVTRMNFRGRNETIGLLLRFGYRQNFSVSFIKPYFNVAQTLGMKLDAGISNSREIAYVSENNRQIFYSQPSGVVYRQFYMNAALNYRPAIYSTHTFQLGFSHHQFADSLLILNPRFAPGNLARVPFFEVSYLFKNDHRDLRAYPLKGHYFDLRIKRQGLGLLQNEIMDVTSVESSVRKFWTLAPRWFAAGGVNAKWSQGNTLSYFNQQGLGFKGDIVRGFEDYVVDGQHFVVFKSNLKFALLPQRSSKIAFVDNPRFSLFYYAIYLNLYTDAGIVDDRMFAQTNPLGNRWLGGTGVGLDFVTYYDKVFRVEWSLNSLGESGLFFHMLAPI